MCAGLPVVLAHQTHRKARGPRLPPPTYRPGLGQTGNGRWKGRPLPRGLPDCRHVSSLCALSALGDVEVSVLLLALGHLLPAPPCPVRPAGAGSCTHQSSCACGPSWPWKRVLSGGRGEGPGSRSGLQGGMPAHLHPCMLRILLPWRGAQRGDLPPPRTCRAACV